MACLVVVCGVHFVLIFFFSCVFVRRDGGRSQLYVRVSDGLLGRKANERQSVRLTYVDLRRKIVNAEKLAMSAEVAS